MDSIRIKNLRCLYDTGTIDLAKLNICVGCNSTGKSTFLRVFPLLQQSLRSSSNSPILWYSNDLVDFGSFEESVSVGREKDPIEFSFNTKINTKNTVSTFPLFFSNSVWSIVFGINSKNDIENYMSFLKIQCDNFVCSIDFSKDGKRIDKFVINDIDFIDNKCGIKFKQRKNFETSFIPLVETIGQEMTSRFYVKYDYDIKFSRNRFSEYAKILQKIENATNNKSKFKKYFEFNVRYLDNVDEANRMYKLIFNSLTVEERNIFFAYEVFFRINLVLSNVEEVIKYFFESVAYIAPFRAKAERYYRKQQYSSIKFDSEGKNITNYLVTLDQEDFHKFEMWCNQFFNIRIKLMDIQGHVSLLISDKHHTEINIADSGFGYSQIVPILVKVWEVERNTNNHYSSPYSLIVIEQPELHLHPRMQAQFVDMIEKIMERTSNIRFLIETHSDVIINRIGSYVSLKKLNEKDVNIFVFEENENDQDKGTSIKKVTFNSDGELDDGWPIGFFAPDMVE